MIEEILVGDELRTNIDGIKEALEKYKSEVLCVLSTTSCFAPRSIDLVEPIGVLCKQYDVFHMVNNAYGL